jgi:hypothetical protein
MNCIWAEYNEHLDDTATVASMVGCWVNPSSLYDELIVLFVRLVSWIGNPSAMLCMYIMVDSKMELPASRHIMHAYSAFQSRGLRGPGDKWASTALATKQ